MYQALITRRYLFSKIMPLLSAAAVALCTAMVLIVWSVMGGFLNMLLGSGKAMIGDVSIAWPVRGIPHYAELVAELEADPLVAAATPTIESLGLLGLESGEQRQVVLVGIEPEGYDAVTGYFDRLYWRPLDEPLPRDEAGEDLRLNGDYRRTFEGWQRAGRTLAEPDGSPDGVTEREAMVLGAEVTRYYRRTAGGFLDPVLGVAAPMESFTIATLPLSRRGVAIQLEYERLPVANEFLSGLYDVDSRYVLLPLRVLQRMLKLDEAVRADPDALPGAVVEDETGAVRFALPETGETIPARATNILVLGEAGAALDDLERRVETIFAAFAERFPEDIFLPATWRDDVVYRWEEKPGLRTFIAAVKKETALVLVLFMFISLTAVFLVTAIFWAMVSEKTRDIGVLRAIGASRAGVAWLFLRYGLAIGVVGSAAGGVIAFSVVHNINPIHEWLGAALGVVIWDPSIYYFSSIPNEVEPWKAATVLAGGVGFSVLGALLPACRAAWMDPVRALRFE